MVRVRHMKHRNLKRVRHSNKLLNFINTQSARLEVTASEVFAQLKTIGSAGVLALPTPEPE